MAVQSKETIENYMGQLLANMVTTPAVPKGVAFMIAKNKGWIDPKSVVKIENLDTEEIDISLIVDPENPLWMKVHERIDEEAKVTSLTRKEVFNSLVNIIEVNKQAITATEALRALSLVDHLTAILEGREKVRVIRV